VVVDRAFLDKFKRGSTYCRDYGEYISSIVEEIRNIMSCRLRSYEGVSENPFCYGLKDIVSVSISHGGFEIFKKECRRSILSLEPRISDIEINEVSIDNEKQEMFIDVSCIIKLNGDKINRKLKL
jgi:predicted component of type VI protein secretion system